MRMVDGFLDDFRVVLYTRFFFFFLNNYYMVFIVFFFCELLVICSFWPFFLGPSRDWWAFLSSGGSGQSKRL